MSSHRKKRSYRKATDIHAFPDDFFATLNVSNLRNGPKMSRIVCRQVRKNDKSLSRICKRERSLDMDESYLVETPELRHKYESVRFPKIDANKISNHSMLVDQPQNDSELCYDTPIKNRYDTSKRRIHRYMKSEDRFRK